MISRPGHVRTLSHFVNVDIIMELLFIEALGKMATFESFFLEEIKPHAYDIL